MQPVRSVSNEHVRRVVKAELLALACRSSQRTLDANASQVNEQASEQERDRAIVIEGSSSICEAHQFIVFYSRSWQQTAGATTTGNGSKHFKWRLFALRVFSRIAIKQTNHSYNLRKRILIPKNKYETNTKQNQTHTFANLLSTRACLHKIVKVHFLNIPTFL